MSVSMSVRVLVRVPVPKGVYGAFSICFFVLLTRCMGGSDKCILTCGVLLDFMCCCFAYSFQEQKLCLLSAGNKYLV